MTVLAIEGFDHISNANDLFAGILTQTHATENCSIAVSGITQFGGKCLTVTTSSLLHQTSAAYTTIYAASGSSTINVGVSILLTPLPNSGYDIGLTDGANCQVFCRFVANRLSIFRGDPMVPGYVNIGGINIVTNMLSSGWAYIEINATLGPSGAISVYCNSRLLVTTSANTSASTVAGGAILGAYDSSGAGFTASYDDLYIADDTGTYPNNTVLGPVRVVTRVPAADSPFISFTPNANSNWQQVSETSMDSDSSYNYDVGTDIGGGDLFPAFPLAATTTQIFALQVKAAVRKTDAGEPLSMSTFLATTSTTPDNQIIITGESIGTIVALSPNYQYISDTYGNNWYTGELWSVDSVNSSMFGYLIRETPF
jgi:hypothetical protein